MDARARLAAAAGVLAVATGLIAALGDVAPLSLLTAAAGALAAGLAVDLARTPPAGPDRVLEPEPTAGLIDDRTGFFVEPYFDASLRARVATARRVLRPLSVGYIEVTDVDDAGEPTDLTDLSKIRDAVLATLREADMAFAVQHGRIGLLLEDTPEDGAMWTVERIRRAVGTDDRGRRLWAGLASYPTHGLSADELASNAIEALARAKEWPQDRIEIAES